MNVIQKFDCTILEGHRDKERQNELFKEGKSRVQWPVSYHNSSPSLAVDVAPYPIVWEDKERFVASSYFVRGMADGLQIRIRHGADWNENMDWRDERFEDWVHFELHPVQPSSYQF